MSKILFFSVHRKPEFRYGDIKIYNHLKKNLEIDFAASSHLMEKKYNYECYQKKHKYDKIFTKANTIWLDNINMARNLIIKYDILILSSLDGCKIFSDFAKFIGIKVIILDQSLSYDYDTGINADLIILKGNYALKIFKKNNKKFKGEIKIISSIDACQLDYPIFNKKSKNNALFILTGAQHHDNWYFKKVNEIYNILKKKKFKIFFKKHPRNYIKKIKYFKNFNYVTNNNFNKILKKVQIIVSIHSNFYQQINYFNYPMIFVDRINFLLPNQLRKKYKFEINQSSIRTYSFAKDKRIINKIIKKEGNKNLNLTRLIDYQKKINFNFNYFGIDLSSKKLNEFISKKKHLKYDISNHKLSEYKSNIIRHVGKEGLKNITYEIQKYIKSCSKENYISNEKKLNNYYKFYFKYLSTNIKNIFNISEKEKNFFPKILKEKNLKVLFVSLNAKPGFEYSDANFVNVLKKRINCTFCGIQQNYYSIGGFYSYDKKFIYDKFFQKLNTIWINYREELKYQILCHDVVIFSPFHGSELYADFAKKNGKTVVLIDSGFNYDFYPNNKADLSILKGENAKKVYLRHKQENLNKNKIIISSCLQQEFLKKKYLISKEKFFRKYKIKRQNFILFLPTGPQYHNNKYKKKYVDICKFFLKKKFHVILKLHPTEYNKRKITKYKTKTNSFSLFKKKKNITVCDQKDFYSAIKYARNVIAINTTAYVEVNLMEKPITFVDRLSFFGIKDDAFYKKRAKIGLYNLINKKIENNKIVGNMDKENGFKFYGQDIKFEHLDEVLKDKSKIIKKDMKTKIFSNNQLYLKNYGEDFYDDLADEIQDFLEETNIENKNYSFFSPQYFNSVSFLKKVIDK